MGSAICTKCKKTLTTKQNQYYCCNWLVRYCTQHYGENCDKLKCNKCNKLSQYSNNMINANGCNKYYCPKCLLSIISTCQQQDNMYKIQCGHTTQQHKISVENVHNFIKGKLCMLCQKQQNIKLSYQLKNQQIVCSDCKESKSNEIKDLLLKCMICQKILRKLENIGTFQDGIIVCEDCVKSTNEQQNKIQQQKQKQQYKKKQQQKRTNQQIQKILQQQLSMQQQQQQPKQQQQQRQQQQQQQYNILLCKICYTQQSCMINKTCRHMMMCQLCCSQLQHMQNSQKVKCPVCKQVGQYCRYLEPILQ